MKKSILPLLIVLLSFSSSADIIYVDVNTPNDNDGSNWANAYKYLQDALADANSNSDINEIWVAQGIYTPDCNSADPNGTGNREASFQLINDVTFKGGYAGYGSPDPNKRNIELYETILSGDLDGNDVPVLDSTSLLTEPTRTENSYHVVTGKNVNANTIIDGFTIKSGNAAIDSWPHEHGGGIFFNSSNCAVNNCIFVENSATYGGGIAGNVACDYLRITNCTFLRNGAKKNGGGIDLYQSDYVVVANCIFIGNFGITNGGGMSIVDSQSSTLTNCIFSGNSELEGTHGGGALINIWGSSPTIANCTFCGNSASSKGGAIANFDDSPIVSNCILWDNIAPTQPQIDSSTTVTYSNVQGGWPGLGNIQVNPRFVDPGYWDDNETPTDTNDDFWVDGNYHLKSAGWRWDSVRKRWHYDVATSRCIDAGNPGSSLAGEILAVPDDPNNIWGQNLRINMGAYGGTAEASIPPYDWALLSDINNNGTVDFIDWAWFASLWLQSGDESFADFNRDSSVDINDLDLLTSDWMNYTTWH